MTMKTLLVISLALFSCCLATKKHRVLKTGEVAYTAGRISTDLLKVTVTDGHFLLLATTSDITNDVTSCGMSYSVKKTKTFLRNPGLTFETIGSDKIVQMLEKCRLHHNIQTRAIKNSDGGDTFNHDIVQNKPFPGDFKTGQPFGPGSHFAIFPGTKWCGFQNVASSMQDLGEHNMTDACCRTHDHCPYYIDRFETKFHYYNVYPWTISHCDCDQHLYDCLKSVNNQPSNDVGNLFFGMLDVKCFTFKNGEYCSNAGSILSKLYCSGKQKGQMAIMQPFAHKWSDPQSDADSRSDVVG